MIYTFFIEFACCLTFNNTEFIFENRKWFLYGGMFGFGSIGIFTDFLSKGKYPYTCVIVLHILASAFLFINILLNIC